MNTSPGLLMLIGISSGTGLVLINILLIACCLHKRHKKNLKGGKVVGGKKKAKKTKHNKCGMSIASR